MQFCYLVIFVTSNNPLSVSSAGFLLPRPMPNLAPKPCRKLGCNALVRDGSSYCAAHKVDAKIGTFADKTRGSRQSRGYGAAWDKLRKQILLRDNGLCQPCLEQDVITPAKQVDHIVAKAHGGTDDESNLQAICVACHKAKTAKESARGRGYANV